MTQFRDDFSKSELFELSADFSNDSSQLDDGTFAFSNLELDVNFFFKYKNETYIIKNGTHFRMT